MAHTIVTNYSDLHPTDKDKSLVVVFDKDGSINLDKETLHNLISQPPDSTLLSFVRVTDDGKLDEHSDHSSDDGTVPHVSLTVDAFFQPSSEVFAEECNEEVLAPLEIDTHELFLEAFKNDHCYTPFLSPGEAAVKNLDGGTVVIDLENDIVTHSIPKPQIPNSKKITILDQQIIPKGKSLINVAATEGKLVLKGADALRTSLTGFCPKHTAEKQAQIESKLKEVKDEESKDEESSEESSSESATNDHESDSDYEDCTNRKLLIKPKAKVTPKPRVIRKASRAEITDTPTQPRKVLQGKNLNRKQPKAPTSLNVAKLVTKKYPKIIKKKVDGGKVIAKVEEKKPEEVKIVPETPKVVKKEKKKPPHVTPAALLSDMTSLFSTPDVIRRVSTDNKKEPSTPTAPAADDKFVVKTNPKLKTYSSTNDSKLVKTQPKEKKEKSEKEMAEEIPQLDETVLANIFSEAVPAPVSTPKDTVAPIGPLSPSLELLSAIQPEEEGLTEDLLMHVAHLVESNENLQEVIDKQVLGKVPEPEKTTPVLLNHSFPLLRTPVAQTSNKQPPTAQKQPIQIIRSDGRVITLPPIEAPATRASKRKNLNVSLPEPAPPAVSPPPAIQNPSPKFTVSQSSLKYSNKKVVAKKPTTPEQIPVEPKVDIEDVAESDTSWNSEDDPYRLWCICKQPHNNRFMICCDYCEEWFHGKCVNITKAMGQQMEEQGIEWNCPNCREKRGQNKSISKVIVLKKPEALKDGTPHNTVKSKAGNCIVCKKAARSSSIYCSDICILKHAQDSANTAQSTPPPHKAQQANSDTKAETRVIVYERETGRCLAGPSAPTAANLKMWLQQHPTFEVVRPGTWNAMRKPVTLTKSPLQQKSKIQTTLKIGPQKQIMLVSPPSKTGPAAKPQFKHSGQDSPPVKKESGAPGTPKQQANMGRIPKLNRPNAQKPLTVRTTSTQQSPSMKSPPPIKRREEYKQRSESVEVNKDITSQQRNTVKKSLIDQMTQRMAETTQSKLAPEDIKKFVNETEMEMFDLIKDTNKYKAKYRSLVFNIGDKKNKSLWQKICERTVTPKQLVRLSPEELASQELAQWRDKEVKHQLELIKKSELDLLSCTKTYVLKTHKGEEVIESRTSAPTELDPNVSVEDLVTALNDPDGTASTPTKVSGHDRSYEQYKNSKHKNHHKTSKKSRKDHTPERKEEKQKSSKDDSSSHKKSHKHASKKSKERESDDKHRKSSHKDRHKDKDRSSRAKSKERTDSSEKKKEGEGDENRSRSRGRSGRRSRSRGRSKYRSRSRPRSENRSRSKATVKQSSLDSSESSKEGGRKRTTSKNEHERSVSQDSSDKSKSCSADVHPEYDPHVAMVTSALSEEDVRRSKDESFDDSSANEILDSSTTYDVATEEYDPAKSGNYSIASSTPIPASAADAKTMHRLSSGTESDQEPSSTVDSIPNSVWNGCINMVDVAKFFVTAHEVSGNCADLGIDLTSELSIVGRINPDTVWDYIVKMKKSGNKDIIVLRLTAANVEERMQYIALYSYLSSRNRLGVVEVSNTASVKDFYIVPLSSHAPIPTVLLPLSGPGFEDIRPHLLIGVILRQQKRKRSQVDPTLPVVTAKIPKLDPKITSSLLNKDPSYTPPTSPRVGSVGPSHSKMPSLPPLPALSSSVKDKIAASLAAADDDNEPYSPGGSDSSKGSESNPAVSQPVNPLPSSIPLPVPAPVDDVLSRKLQELDRKIAEERKQIISISKNITPTALDEPYSPSRPMTPSASAPLTTLSDISLPSNLQEILANIQKKTRSGPVEEYVPEKKAAAPAVGDVDMRILNPPAPNFAIPPPPFFPPKVAGKLSSLSEEELLSMVPAEDAPDPYIPTAAPRSSRHDASKYPTRSHRKHKLGTDDDGI